jgi:serralysin
VLPSGTVSFAAGETSKTITINVAGDLADEANEGFTVTLTNPVGATLGTSTASGSIRDDDTATPGFYTGTTLADVFVANAAVPWIINGRAGVDQLTGNAGSDIIFGGTGDDILSGAGGDDIFIDGKADGKDQFDGGAGYDRVLASIDSADIGIAGLTGIEEVSSGGFSGVFISGRTVADLLDFSSVRLTGITAINSGSGNDTVTGSLGADTINGGAGADLIAGGGGRDIFDYNAVGDSGLGATKADRIIDFQSGIDVIDLSGIDANGGVTGAQAFDFIGTAEFTAVGQLRIGTDIAGNVAIFANTVGSLVADLQISLTNNATPLVSDFVL